MTMNRPLPAKTSERSTSSRLLDLMPFGVILVDKDARVVSCNRHAERALDRGDALRVADGRLHGPSPDHAQRIEDAVRGVITPERGRGHSSETALTLKCQAGQPLLRSLVVSLLSPGESVLPGKPAAGVFLCDVLSDVNAEPERIGRLFDLTAAESRVAMGLYDGLSINEMAAEWKLSRNTIRWHVKHILQKCGVNSQAQFVRLLHRSPIGVAAGAFR